MADISKIKLPSSDTVYNIKDQVARDLIANLPSPMVFKGSLGIDGTITTLPTASSSNVGFTYKVITAGTYDSKVAKVGDIFVCAEVSTSTYEWVLVPSGDEPSGTVTSITAGTGLAGGTITTSGTISHATTTAVSASAVKVGNDNLGHVVIGNALTTDDIAAGSVDVWILNCGTSTLVV